MTVSDPLYDQMLASLKYPNPPAGFVAILVNTGGDEPIVIHVDVHDGIERNFRIADGQVTFKVDTKPEMTLISPEDSLQPKVPPPTPEGRVRANSMIMSCIFGNKKIQAIKEIRSLEGLSLKDAKDLCDAIYAKGPNP